MTALFRALKTVTTKKGRGGRRAEQGPGLKPALILRPLCRD
jgi:hypothetical protein